MRCMSVIVRVPVNKGRHSRRRRRRQCIDYVNATNIIV